VHGEWKTAAVDDCHECVAFAALWRIDDRAPFFAQRLGAPGHPFTLGRGLDEVRIRSVYKYWLDHGKAVNALDNDKIGDTPPDPGPWLYERRWGLVNNQPDAASSLATAVTRSRLRRLQALQAGIGADMPARQLSRMNATLSMSARSHLVRQ